MAHAKEQENEEPRTQNLEPREEQENKEQKNKEQRTKNKAL